MAEITGGQLNFEMTVDPDELKKGLTDAEGKLEGFSKLAEKTGEKLDTALKGTATESLKELANEATKTGSTLKSVGDVKIDFGLTKENLAIQKQVIAEIKKNIEEIEKRAKDMAPGMAQASVLGELKPLQEELAAEEKALASLEVEMKKTAVSATTLSSKYLEAKNRLAELTLANKQGTPEYVKAEAEVRKYGTALSDTNARAKALTAGTIGGLAQGLSLVTGTMATGTALLGAFGGKSEELNQIMLKTQALLAATVTLQEIKNTTVQKGGVISGIMAVQEMARSRATSLATVNTIRATIAQKALNLVANANPYILLATAILTVVGALALYSAASSESAKRTKLVTDLNKQMADSVAEPIISFKKLQIQWNALGNDLKAKEKFIKDNKDRFQELGVSVKNVNDAENLLIKNSVNFQAALMMRARAAAAASIAADKYKEALSAQLQDKQEKRTLKEGSYIEQQNTRLKREARDLVGATLAEISKQGFADADYTARLSVGYDQSGKDFLKKGNITEFVKPEKSPKGKITKEDKADEYFPPGSVAEIEKRMAAIDKALSKSNNDKSTELLKKRRIEIALELAAAEKKIRIRSFDEEMEETKKQIELRDKLIQAGYSKDQVDQMLPDVKDKSYIGYLEETETSLKNLVIAGDNTEQTATNITKIREAIDEFEGNKTFLDEVSDSIERLKSKFSGSKLIAELEKFKKASILDSATEAQSNSRKLAAAKAIEEENKAIETTQRQFYNDFLKEKETFEQQKKSIDDKYNSIDAQINSSSNSNEEKSRLLKESAKARGEEYSSAFLDGIGKSDMWQKAFGNIAEMTNGEIRKNIANLKKQLEKMTESNADPKDIKVITDQIKDLQSVLNNNPFERIKDSFQKMNDQSLTTEERLEGAKQGFLAMGEGVQMIGDALGGFSEETQDVVNDIMAIGSAAFDMAKSIASGDVAGMISAGIKLIGSIAAAFNGDKKKEREIRKQQEAIKSLELAYNDLAFAAERAIGAQKYDGQRDLIRNLQEQKIAIEQMMRLEQEKKKGDKDKIEGYQSQIQSINQSIIQLKEGIIKDVLQTDIPQMASSIGDALLEAFGKGEDGIKAVDDAFDQMVKNILKNQLNKVLEKQMEGVYKNFLTASGFNEDGTGSFNGLTPAEIADLRAQVQAASSYGQQFIEAYGSIFEGLDSPSEGLKGDIKGITERTAGALESQINAIRIYQVEGLNIHKSNQSLFVQSLQNLVMIEANTRNLIQIRQDISEMNGKMKKGLAGFP